MERIKIDLPTNFTFSTNISIRITDINYGNHLGNDSILSLIHEARMQFLSKHGYTELSIENVGLIMADSAIEYKQEVYYGEIISIHVTAAGFDRLGFDLFYKLTTVRNNQEIIVAKAKTGMMGYDYQQKKKVSIPAIAIEKLTSPVGL